MNLTERVEYNFSASLQAGRDAIPQLASPIVKGAGLMVESLLQGGKIMSCGNGGSAAAAQYFSSLMLNRFQRERPGLPAMTMTADNTTMTAIALDYDFDELFAKQIHALGQNTDLLLTIGIGDDTDNLIAAVEAAHEREMRIVALTGGPMGRLASRMYENDIQLRVPDKNGSRILEIHFMTLHSICDLIDQQLLGN
ncbi:MAG: SIS domain-containing protein [Gammaproteobacteria bacterium]|nr:SIS domain-containing protein [Gammaproteobacteria bacterium]